MSSTQELLEASLQLNVRLASCIGILYSREEREQFRFAILDFVFKAASLSEIPPDRAAEMVNALRNAPFDPITDGLLDEQEGS